MANEITANVASCVIKVSDLDRSLAFYRDVFSCRVAVREDDMALLLTPKGFQIYLHVQEPLRPRGIAEMGVRHLVWSTDTLADLEQVRDRLRVHDPAVYTHTDPATEVTYLEGSGPDEERVIVTYPSPHELPRTVIAERLHD
jgi:catechol 2,3-dioxygenase-like lactoylglutathione lyase family enzyme